MEKRFHRGPFALDERVHEAHEIFFATELVEIGQRLHRLGDKRQITSRSVLRVRLRQEKQRGTLQRERKWRREKG